MSVVVNKRGGDFEADIPDEGRCLAKVVDLYGPFERTGQYGTQEKVRCVWALYDKKGRLLHKRFQKDGRDVDGWPMTVQEDYTAVISEKSKLGKLLANLTGEIPDEREIDDGFDLEAALMGIDCELKVVHSPDGKYANIEWVEVLVPEEGEPELEWPEDGRKVDTGYTRIQYRDKKPGDPQPERGRTQERQQDRRRPRDEEEPRGRSQRPQGRPQRRDEEDERPRRSARREDPRKGTQSPRRDSSYDDFQPPAMDDDDDLPF